MRVWLHQAHDEDGDAGHVAWDLTHPGFATWAPTEGEVLEKAPAKLAEYRRFLSEHGLRGEIEASAPPAVGIGVEVVERAAENEILFRPDHEAADRARYARRWRCWALRARGCSPWCGTSGCTPRASGGSSGSGQRQGAGG